MTDKSNEEMSMTPLHIGDIYLKKKSQSCELSFNIKYDNVIIYKRKNASKGYYEFTCEIKYSDLIDSKNNEQKDLDDSRVSVKKIENDKSTLIKNGVGSKIKKTIQKVNGSKSSKIMKNKLKVSAGSEEKGAETFQASTSTSDVNMNTSSSEDSDAKTSDEFKKNAKALKSLNVDDQYLVIVNKNINKPGIYSLSTYEDMMKLSKKTSRYKLGPFITIHRGKDNSSLKDFIDTMESNKLNCVKNEMKTDILNIEDLFDHLNKLNSSLKYNIRYYNKSNKDNINGSTIKQSNEKNEETDLPNEKKAKVQQKKVQPQKSKRVENENKLNVSNVKESSDSDNSKPGNSGTIISDVKKTKLNPVKRKLFVDNVEKSQSIFMDEELPLKKIKTNKKIISQTELTAGASSIGDLKNSKLSGNEIINTDDKITKKQIVNKFIVQDSSAAV